MRWYAGNSTVQNFNKEQEGVLILRISFCGGWRVGARPLICWRKCKNWREPSGGNRSQCKGCNNCMIWTSEIGGVSIWQIEWFLYYLIMCHQFPSTEPSSILNYWLNAQTPPSIIDDQVVEPLIQGCLQSIAQIYLLSHKMTPHVEFLQKTTLDLGLPPLDVSLKRTMGLCPYHFHSSLQIHKCRGIHHKVSPQEYPF